jgi:MtN3 and saliva related transmembrane protein
MIYEYRQNIFSFFIKKTTKGSRAPELPIPGMDKNTWVGLMASIFTTLAAIPQLIKIVKEKKAENISLLWVGILIAGLAGWIFYGILKKDPIILVSNSVAVAINTGIAFFALKFKKSAGNV